jgi:hypothetical protein
MVGAQHQSKNIIAGFLFSNFLALMSVLLLNRMTAITVAALLKQNPGTLRRTGGDT